jgi:hypothetical protein
MIDMQLLTGVLVALAGLFGLAIALSVAMLAAARVTKSGQAPSGGIRPDLPPHPQPHSDHARTLVLR